jgi:hypothetical protein
MFEIVGLCGYDYRDTYATKKLVVVTEAVDPARIRSITDSLDDDARQRAAV